jgi:hypothetical protein
METCDVGCCVCVGVQAGCVGWAMGDAVFWTRCCTQHAPRDSSSFICSFNCSTHFLTPSVPLFSDKLTDMKLFISRQTLSGKWEVIQTVHVSNSGAESVFHPAKWLVSSWITIVRFLRMALTLFWAVTFGRVNLHSYFPGDKGDDVSRLRTHGALSHASCAPSGIPLPHINRSWLRNIGNPAGHIVLLRHEAEVWAGRGREKCK